MVVEQALRDVKQLLLGRAAFGQPVEQILEVAGVRLVGTDLLGSEDVVEFYLERGVASGKAVSIDVGQYNQSEMLLEIGQCLGAVGKGRPIADRVTEGPCRLGVGGHVQLLGQKRIDFGEE